METRTSNIAREAAMGAGVPSSTLTELKLAGYKIIIWIQVFLLGNLVSKNGVTINKLHIKIYIHYYIFEIIQPNSSSDIYKVILRYIIFWVIKLLVFIS